MLSQTFFLFATITAQIDNLTRYNIYRKDKYWIVCDKCISIDTMDHQMITVLRTHQVMYGNSSQFSKSAIDATNNFMDLASKLLICKYARNK